MRFHVDTLLGLKEGCKLPTPAWEDTINLSGEPSTNTQTEPLDPCFPFVNGPGHKDATPQQLQIMRKMLDGAGIASFRPDFSKSVSAKENKLLWNICLKIFHKLVECGEYNGVVIGGKNDTFIKKCLDTYAQSLSKRYVSNLVS